MAYKITKEEDQEVALTVGFSYPFFILKIVNCVIFIHMREFKICAIVRYTFEAHPILTF